MISSDYSSEDDEVEDESLVLQPSKKLPVIIFRPEVSRMSCNHRPTDQSLRNSATEAIGLHVTHENKRVHPAAFVFQTRSL